MTEDITVVEPSANGAYDLMQTIGKDGLIYKCKIRYNMVGGSYGLGDLAWSGGSSTVREWMYKGGLSIL